MRKKAPHHGQLVMFPGGGAVAPLEPDVILSQGPSVITVNSHLTPAFEVSVSPPLPVVLSGSYRKDFEGLRQLYEELQDVGCNVLSPSSVVAVNEVDGFVYMDGEETQTPESIEAHHLDAIQRSQFVWLHAPNGYVGPTAALEVGFANAAGVPVFSKDLPADKVLQSFVRVVPSPSELIKTRLLQVGPPKPALKAFQEYYRRVAIQRGYNNEGAKDCLLLMVEEVGELARALRKRLNLTRHAANNSSESQELADVFLYVVHMANLLDLDLAAIVQKKEFLNLRRVLGK